MYSRMEYKMIFDIELACESPARTPLDGMIIVGTAPSNVRILGAMHACKASRSGVTGY